MEKVKQAKTLMGVEYKYSGSLNKDLVIYKNKFKVSPKIINIIRSVIEQKSPVLMGACRDNPSPYSIGIELYEQKINPQVLSYVIPLLIEEGFCKANDKKPFIITKI